MNIERVAEAVAELRTFNHHHAADLLEATAKQLGVAIAELDWTDHADGNTGVAGFLAVIRAVNPPRDQIVRKSWRDTLTLIERETAKATP